MLLALTCDRSGRVWRLADACAACAAATTNTAVVPDTLLASARARPAGTAARHARPPHGRTADGSLDPQRPGRRRVPLRPRGPVGSRAFADLCDQLGVTRSMGAVGTSADNAACESFHASLKRETLQGARDYRDAGTCRKTVFAWLTRYNTRRRHSANGHLSPNEYEHRHHTAKLTLAA